MKAVHRFSLFFAPGVFQSLISLAVLPVSTYFLDPADFGLFALISSITAVIGVIATLGSSYLLARHFPVAERPERIRLISSLVWMGLLVASVCGCLLVAAWPTIVARIFRWHTDQTTLLVMAVGTMFLSLPWVIAGDVIRLEGRAHIFAIAVGGQSLLSASVLLFALIILGAGVEALFISSIIGASVLFTCALRVIAPYIRFTADRQYSMELLRLGRLFFLSSAAETLHQVIERTVLTARGGLSQLGLYTHSQMYRLAAGMPASAIADTAWPVTLAEARAVGSDFKQTRLAWTAAHLWLTVAGLILATLGSHIISLLTHDKFTDSHVLAALWAVYLLVQNTGKPQTALFYAYGHGGSYAVIQAVAMVSGTGLLFLLVPTLGMYGAFGALFSQQVLMRVCVQIRARTIKPSPFQDGWALAGSALIAGALLCKVTLNGGLGMDLTILAGSLSLLLVVAHGTISELWRRI